MIRSLMLTWQVPPWILLKFFPEAPESKPRWVIEIGGLTVEDDGRPLAVELCCGSANLSLHLQRAGFNVVAIDYSRNRHKPKVQVANVDLTSEEGQLELFNLLCHPALAFVFMSPPCGTASRARGKAINPRLKRAGWPEPKPLRSNDEPYGLSHLESSDPAQFLRVQSANKIYDLCAEVASRLSELAIPWAIENPANYLMWWLEEMKNLHLIEDSGDTLFHACMHGGQDDSLASLSGIFDFFSRGHL
jgi:hypothetical protein